jgi:hypothetical protein
MSKIINSKHTIYTTNGHLYNCFYKDNKKEGECKEYFSNGQLSKHFFYKDNKIDGECKEYFSNGQLNVHCFYKNDKKEGEYKFYYCENREIYKYNYYINDKIIVNNFNFKIKFALLKFKDILKTRYRKLIYNELDKYNIRDISDIIGSYIFTLSKYNKINKRIL